MEDKEYIKSSAKWLFEMNWINNDYVKSALLANIYTTSRFIKNVDILVDQNNKRMLIYTELSFFGKLFKRQTKISKDVLEIVGDALPSYELRVIYDYSLFNKALEIMNPAPIEKVEEESKEVKES